MILTYIGVAEEYDIVGKIDDTNERLNVLLGNDLFIDEGQLPSANWSGLPLF